MNLAVNVPTWDIEEETGYKPITTFWVDFSIAESIGAEAIKDTFERAFSEWKTNYKYLTELVLVLNTKIWQWHDVRNDLAEIYNDIYWTAVDYAQTNLKDDELDYYYQLTD